MKKSLFWIAKYKDYVHMGGFNIVFNVNQRGVPF